MSASSSGLRTSGENDMKAIKNGREDPRQMEARKPAAEEVLGSGTMAAARKRSASHNCILPVPISDLRTGLTVADLKQSFLDTLF
jgi:hypothetical protein